jgi:hypothetical protein
MEPEYASSDEIRAIRDRAGARKANSCASTALSLSGNQFLRAIPARLFGAKIFPQLVQPPVPTHKLGGLITACSVTSCSHVQCNIAYIPEYPQ